MCSPEPRTAQQVTTYRPRRRSALRRQNTCSILDLTLGPLHLDLLGLIVDLNQVHLMITAQRGPGNLLGNLLCAVAGLLDGGANGNAIQQLLNQINAILGAALASRESCRIARRGGGSRRPFAFNA